MNPNLNLRDLSYEQSLALLSSFTKVKNNKPRLTVGKDKVIVEDNASYLEIYPSMVKTEDISKDDIRLIDRVYLRFNQLKMLYNIRSTLLDTEEQKVLKNKISLLTLDLEKDPYMVKNLLKKGTTEYSIVLNITTFYRRDLDSLLLLIFEGLVASFNNLKVNLSDESYYLRDLYDSSKLPIYYFYVVLKDRIVYYNPSELDLRLFDYKITYFRFNSEWIQDLTIENFSVGVITIQALKPILTRCFESNKDSFIVSN